MFVDIAIARKGNWNAGYISELLKQYSNRKSDMDNVILNVQ